MTKGEINKLDKLYQQTLMEAYDNNSILGGEAHLIHHYFSRTALSLRWWFPNGIPLSTEQHNIVHSSDLRAKPMIHRIVEIKSPDWSLELGRRKHTIVKNLTYNKVLKYLNGEIEDYI